MFMSGCGERPTVKEKGETVEGELVQRAYTPISKQTDKGFIDMLIKYVAR